MQVIHNVMSTRTILEINHDQLSSLEGLPHDELLALLRKATSCNSELNDSKGYGVKHSHGLTTLATRHHSSRLRVVVQMNTIFDDAAPQHRDIKESA